MKLLDLLKLSISNLKRRKLRTVLTVLGVLIGTASVVTMLSLGIGLDELNKESIAQSGSLKAIDVTVPYNRQDDSSNKKTEPLRIKDDTIETFSKIEHVEGVSPVLSTYVIIMQGPYMQNTQINGVNEEYMAEIKLESGHIPTDKKILNLYMEILLLKIFRILKSRMNHFMRQISFRMWTTTSPCLLSLTLKAMIRQMPEERMHRSRQRSIS